VVVIVTVEAMDVHRNSGTLSEALQTVGDHLGAKLAEPLSLETEVDDTVGTVGNINDGAG
jgi:hypothetical protein